MYLFYPLPSLWLYSLSDCTCGTKWKQTSSLGLLGRHLEYICFGSIIWLVTNNQLMHQELLEQNSPNYKNLHLLMLGKLSDMWNSWKYQHWKQTLHIITNFIILQQCPVLLKWKFDYKLEELHCPILSKRQLCTHWLDNYHVITQRHTLSK